MNNADHLKELIGMCDTEEKLSFILEKTFMDVITYAAKKGEDVSDFGDVPSRRIIENFLTEEHFDD